ncbi:MAG: hypothetical protein U0359_42205, partial [Byssovorax sp.]
MPSRSMFARAFAGVSLVSLALAAAALAGPACSATSNPTTGTGGGSTTGTTSGQGGNTTSTGQGGEGGIGIDPDGGLPTGLRYTGTVWGPHPDGKMPLFPVPGALVLASATPPDPIPACNACVELGPDAH